MKKILLVGGGTLGPVTPLLALAEAMRQRQDFTVLGLAGGRRGPERIMAEGAGLSFFSITVGKWRRPFDLRNFFTPFLVLMGVLESVGLLWRLKPSVIVSGGSFVGLPVLYAAWLLGIPSLTLQQDLVPSLANRCAAKFVSKIAVVFPEVARFFPAAKTVVTGNPIRQSLFEGSAERGRQFFQLEPSLPTVFIFGGGTGAASLNEIVIAALPELTQFCQIIHLAGKGKLSTANRQPQTAHRYHPYEFLTDQMADAYAAADLVVGRAGIGTITELAALGKPAILIPIPDSHQEANARYLEERGAAVVISQKQRQPEDLIKKILMLLKNPERQMKLCQAIGQLIPADAAEQMIKVIEELTK
ncbi:undecaprenyldiphospho-muramoylpentapeptide beta-N-acetylglucosaminyltransferase [Candidatus Uhrbacteria bacterium]|nr:undecaprenyldiphospho-muramoylpentapeptide beta-N-acetylglucosaminyltransferase [Candidatus Uhrbacteria bacterium]